MYPKAILLLYCFFFNDLLGLSEENIINRTNSTGLQQFFFNMFFFAHLGFSFGYNRLLTVSIRFYDFKSS